MAVLLLGVFIVANGWAQGNVSADVATVLRSDIPTVRGPAVVALASAPVPLLSRSDLQEALLDALKAEDRLIEQNYEAFVQGLPPVLPDEGHDYYDDLATMAMQLLDILPSSAALRSRFVEELIRSSYNPDSRLAQRLALEGDAIVGPVIQLTRARGEPWRWNAYSLIAMLFRGADARALRAPLTSNSRELLRDAARQGLRDPAPGARKEAIAAVVAARDTHAIPMLEELARNDPDSGEGKTPVLARYSVRHLATEAIQALRSVKNPGR